MKVFRFVGWLSIVHAALIFTDRTWTDVVTGVPFAVTWSGNIGAVTLTLDNGTASAPNLVHHIQCKYISPLSVFCVLQPIRAIISILIRSSNIEKEGVLTSA
jgi:hypothetical protein